MLRFFASDGEPLPEGVAFDDERVAYQLSGADADRAIAAWEAAHADAPQPRGKARLKAPEDKAKRA